jgi:hypothetical protein
MVWETTSSREEEFGKGFRLTDVDYVTRRGDD